MFFLHYQQTIGMFYIQFNSFHYLENVFFTDYSYSQSNLIALFRKSNVFSNNSKQISTYVLYRKS